MCFVQNKIFWYFSFYGGLLILISRILYNGLDFQKKKGEKKTIMNLCVSQSYF